MVISNAYSRCGYDPALKFYSFFLATCNLILKFQLHENVHFLHEQYRVIFSG